MTRTTLTELADMMARPSEDNWLEFKKAEAKYDKTKLFKRCVAIANEGGGKILFGITDKLPRLVVGSQAFPNRAKIEEEIFNKLKFRVVVEELDPPHPDGRILIFHIPSRPKGTAFQFEGQYLMRVGETTPVMSEDRLRAIFNEGQPEWLDEIAAENCSADAVVRRLDTQCYFDLLEIPYPSNRNGVLEKFQSEGLIVQRSGGWDITNLGAIVFAKDLNGFDGFARRAARFIHYEGTNKLSTRLDQSAVKGIAVGFEGLVEFVASHVDQNEVLTKALREEVRMFPTVAIRELVANALIHQDFNETGSSVRIELYSDRLEISNPGIPLIATDRFIDEYKSRNEKLADLMRRLGICEEKSSGIDRVVTAAEAYQLPAPDFRVAEVHTSVVMFAYKKFADMDKADRIRACYQHGCLKYVMNQKMTNQSLRNRFQLGDKKTEAVSRVLKHTMEKGLIRLGDPNASSTRYRDYLPFWA